MPRAIRFVALALASVALLPLGLPAAPQIVNRVNGIGLIDYARKPDFKVGTWVQYRITGTSETGLKDDYVVTVLIAGAERFWGEDCFWVETWTEPQGRPRDVVATLMSYSIFGDTLAIPRLKLYMRKIINSLDNNGNPIETVTKRPSASLSSRKPVADKNTWYVNTMGTDTVMVPRGTFTCKKVLMHQGVNSTADVGDSSFRTEVREDRFLFVSDDVPITSVVREDMENSIRRRAWKIGDSRDTPTNTMDKATGTARLLDYGTGLTPELVPQRYRTDLRPLQPVRKPGSGEGTRKGARSKTG